MYYFCSGSKPLYVLFQHLRGVCEQGLSEGPDAGGGGDRHARHRPVCLHQHRSVPSSSGESVKRFLFHFKPLHGLKFGKKLFRGSPFVCTSVRNQYNITNLPIFPPVRFIFEFACALVMVLAIKESAKLSFLPIQVVPWSPRVHFGWVAEKNKPVPASQPILSEDS
jgi:hypothetical protein